MSRIAILWMILLAALGSIPATGAEPRIRMVKIDNGIKLETLDWGGGGRDVVLLAGLGNTAHIFEAFAPRLAEDCHVYGLTRRGYGASTHTLGGYTQARLAQDIIAVCDSLGLDAPVLIGHSLAGAEMAHAARLRPRGFSGFVFLDAAYDASMVADYADLAPPPVQPQLRTEELMSAAGVTEFLQRTRGFTAPAGEIAALYVFAADGRLKDVNHSKLAQGLIMDAMTPPPFERLDAPVLAIFAKPTLESLYPAHGEFSPEAQRTARARVRLLRQLMSAQLATLEATCPGAWTHVWDGASHHLFLTEPTRVLTAVRALLAALPD